MVNLRTYLHLLLMFLVGASATNAAAIKKVTTKYQNADDFKTLSSYFTDGDNIGPRIIEKSQANSWDGLYFIVEFEDRPETFPNKYSVLLEVITPFSPQPRSYVYPLSATDKFTWEIYLGITGSDWPNPDAQPLAWKITISDIESTVISEKQSYLWK